MDERHFLVLNLLRHLPPVPKLPEAIQQLLVKTDDLLAAGEPGLAVEALAVLFDSIYYPAANLRPPADPCDVNAACYFADCLAAALAHRPASNDVDRPSPDDRLAAVIGPSLATDRDRNLTQAIIDALHAAGWQALLCVTDERTDWQPALRVWAPTRAADWNPDHPRVRTIKQAADRVVEMPRSGGPLDWADAIAERLVDQAPAVAVGLGGLHAPVTAAVLHRRVARWQVSVTDAEPCLLDAIDAVAAVGFAPPHVWQNRLAMRGVALGAWPDDLQRLIQPRAAAAAAES
jgi:hypothetical protein